MFILKNGKFAGYFLLIFLSISAINSVALGGRILQDVVEKPQQWSQVPDKGFFANVDREVPSCPDPLHNR
ncbi:hypothetical protein DCAR_0103531 [Daucus carota subsp. sativus]|uniref:Uncharacterized protein n=1 Tax=Daucus carota subsp. sativus TaxID=79200 RepID=A0AAF0W9S6_DAUCS|nr:hypothetical protein DCAR_0103531 [Daucus carota subsp. sativus]